MSSRMIITQEAFPAGYGTVASVTEIHTHQGQDFPIDGDLSSTEGYTQSCDRMNQILWSFRGVEYDAPYYG